MSPSQIRLRRHLVASFAADLNAVQVHNPNQNDHQLRRMPITDYDANRSRIADDADVA